MFRAVHFCMDSTYLHAMCMLSVLCRGVLVLPGNHCTSKLTAQPTWATSLSTEWMLMESVGCWEAAYLNPPPDPVEFLVCSHLTSSNLLVAAPCLSAGSPHIATCDLSLCTIGKQPIQVHPAGLTLITCGQRYRVRCRMGEVKHTAR